LEAKKLRDLGWSAAYSIHTGIRETVDILRRVRKHETID